MRVALVYPNRYHVGMASLGFQTVYRRMNSIERVLCERGFLPEQADAEASAIKTLESARPIAGFDIVAFSISYENDFLNVLTILRMSGIPLKSGERRATDPLILAGGISCFLNPEPLSPFIDCFLIGEAEPALTLFFEGFDPARDRWAMLESIARNVPGAYVPRFYRESYDSKGRFFGLEPLCDVPKKIRRSYVKDLSTLSTTSVILTTHAAFEDAFLVEIGRGCAHGCRFCSTGFVYRPPRFRPAAGLIEDIRHGLKSTSKIGLMGAAVSDHPELLFICRQFQGQGIQMSFSSIRADAVSDDLVTALEKGGVKTAAIAPDAGSQRMRDVINKGVNEEDILSASERLVAGGIPNLRLYFMIGLPTETMEDVDAINVLCKRIKHRFLKSSITRKHIGNITVSLNCFVPKPFTPFQWAAMDDVQTLKSKSRKIKDGLKRVANVTVHSDIPRWAYIQGLFSRGDRNVSNILSAADRNRGNWAATLKSTAVNPDFYVLRERTENEIFPWDFIDHGIDKRFLFEEYRRALEGKTSPPCPVEDCFRCGVCNL